MARGLEMEERLNTDNTVAGSRTEAATQATRCGLGDAVTLPTGASSRLGQIDRYALLRELGGGGFGVVYLARDTVAGIEVAVKGLPPMVRNNAEELERIRENFALVSRLYHPNIAPALVLHQAHEVSYADDHVREALRVLPGDYLMVMAYAPGVTLNKWRRQFPEGKVPVGQALEVCRQIASALDYAHGEKIIHRDVKPSNIVAENLENGAVRCRVLDFGLAAEIHSSLSRVSTETFDTSGTRPYMAPEQWQGKRQGPQTDQYALAVLFYELVGGVVPFASAFATGDALIMLNVVAQQKPEPLPQLSPAQSGALLKGLSKESANRFATCGELVAALNGRQGEGGKTASYARRVRIALIASEVVLVMAAFGVGVQAFLRATRTKAPLNQSLPARPVVINAVKETLPVKIETKAVQTPQVSGARTGAHPAAGIVSPPPKKSAAAVEPQTPVTTETVKVPLVSATNLAVHSPPPALGVADDVYSELVKKMEAGIPAGWNGPVRIGVGNFFSGETRLMSAYSAVLRKELQGLLAKNSRFQLVSRERLAAWLVDGHSLDKRVLEAGAEAVPVPLDGLDAVFRGRFASSGDEIKVNGEVVWLARGKVAKIEVASSAKRVMSRLWPELDLKQIGAIIRLADLMMPQNEAGSLKSLADIETRAKKVPHDFDIRLMTADARQDYSSGEECRYRFSSSCDCHVAVLCHQVDGTSVVLFPNKWSQETWVPAGQVTDIPGVAKRGFQIVVSPPFGADVVQAVACTTQSALHRLVAEVSSRAAPQQAFGVVPRGVFTRGLDDSLNNLASPPNGAKAVRWSEVRLVICTYPRLGE